MQLHVHPLLGAISGGGIGKATNVEQQQQQQKQQQQRQCEEIEGVVSKRGSSVCTSDASCETIGDLVPHGAWSSGNVNVDASESGSASEYCRKSSNNENNTNMNMTMNFDMDVDIDLDLDLDLDVDISLDILKTDGATQQQDQAQQAPPPQQQHRVEAGVCDAVLTSHDEARALDDLMLPDECLRGEVGDAAGAKTKHEAVRAHRQGSKREMGGQEVPTGNPTVG